MFAKLFKRKTAIPVGVEVDVETGADPVADSRAIRASVDYYVLRAAWDEYVTIKKQDPDYQYGDATPTPCWKALERVEQTGGDFSKFPDEEQHLLRALRKGFLIYDDVMHTLIDHHSDEVAAADLYAKYPQIHDHVPREYDNPQHIIEVLIEVVRDYQWQLEHYSMTHGMAIDAAIAPHKAEQIKHRAVALPDAHKGAYDGKESYISDSELGVPPPQPSGVAATLASTVLDKLAVMEADLAVSSAAQAPASGRVAGVKGSVLDPEAVSEALATQQISGGENTSRVLDVDEVNKLMKDTPK